MNTGSSYSKGKERFQHPTLIFPSACEAPSPPRALPAPTNPSVSTAVEMNVRLSKRHSLRIAVRLPLPT